MSKTTSLFRKNAQTFYNYRTGKPASIATRYALIVVSAFALSLLFADRSDNLYLGIITAQSILAGFGFNVMISLAFNRSIQAIDGMSIERVAKIEKINVLAKELFFNVAYFNAVAIGSIVLSVALLLVPAFWSGWPETARAVAARTTSSPTDTIWWLKGGEVLVRRIALFALYALVIDSFTTFVRTVQRASHYFENRISLDPTS